MSIDTVRTADRRTTVSPVVARVAVLGIGGFFAALIVATLLQPDYYDSTRDFISGLAGEGARFPAVMMAGFETAAVGLLATAFGLWRRYRRIPATIAAFFLTVSGVATGVAGLARFDCTFNDAACLAKLDAGLSHHAVIHGRAALLVFLPAILATLFMAIAQPTLRRGLLLGLAAAAQLSLILLTEEAGTDWTGLFQRLVMLLNLVVPPVVAFLPALRPAPRPVR
jgi:hypothetical protein